MLIDDNVVHFFDNIPDELLIRIAMNDWFTLQKMCMILTLDDQILREKFDKYLKRDLDF
jgi:hypothetical protein